MKKKLAEHWVKGCKERGEWAELCFMAKAAGMGLSVSKPYGDSQRYDVLVEAGGRILRVQVKSTLYRRRGNEYSLNVMGPGRKSYEKGSVDFFAVYLIPADAWYIIPYAALGKKLTLHFCPGGGRQKYAKYREAWHLLGCAREKVTIQACAERECLRVSLLPQGGRDSQWLKPVCYKTTPERGAEEPLLHVMETTGAQTNERGA